MDTQTSYLGIRLPHPFIAGASPLGYSVDSIKRLEDAGCAAVVLHSLFEEQIAEAMEGRIAHFDPRDAAFAGVLAQFPRSSEYPLAPAAYADHVMAAKSAVRIPIIASLNGRTSESWLKFAHLLEQAGADAIELNFYDVVANVNVPGAAVEGGIVDAVRAVKRQVRIPVAVKMSPFFSAFANLAQRLDQAGASGLVLFNRFYQPDIDLATMQVSPQAELSSSAELPLRLRWLAALRGRVHATLIASGGVATPEDGLKALLAGADAVQLVSALLRHGPSYVTTMVRALERFLDWKQLSSVDEMCGLLSHESSADPTLSERAHYIRTLHTWTS
jgi:dihydroorotate dehydrogenase (fumarate)